MKTKRQISISLFVIFSFSFLTAQTNPSPNFFEGYWVDFNELQKLRHEDTWKEFPFSNDMLFFESIKKDQKNLIRKEFDYGYTEYELLAKGDQWETQPCIFNTKNCGGHIKFDVIKNDTLAIVNYPNKNYPLQGIKVYTKIRPCEDLKLFWNWAYLSELFNGKFGVTSVEDQTTFEIEFKKDLTVTGFKDYDKFRINLRNSKAIIYLYNEENYKTISDYFIFEKVRGVLILSEIKDLETFKKVSQQERVVENGKWVWKLEEIEK